MGDNNKVGNDARGFLCTLLLMAVISFIISPASFKIGYLHVLYLYCESGITRESLVVI